MVAAAAADKSIEQALEEKFELSTNGGPEDPVNPSGSPEICGADTKFEAGTVKFSIYSEYSGDKRFPASDINDCLPGAQQKI